MREIKFRGKSIESKTKGQWIHGYYTRFKALGKYFHFIYDEQNRAIEVDPETVGQYTGLPDSNRQELFEGDKWQYHGVVYVVTWHPDKANFYFKHPSPNAYDDDHIEMEWSTHGQKVGNRWDTPEGRTET